MGSYLERLRREGLSLIVLKGGKTLFTSSGDGIRPLFDAIDMVGLAGLGGSVVVDKVVGKAAALLVSYFKAKEVHCVTLSVRGREVLDRRGIGCYWERVVPEVLNKAGTDICPFEKTVLDVDEPRDGYELLLAKLRSLRGGAQC